MEKWVFEWNWIGGALRNLWSEERKAMIPFLEKAASLLTYVGSEGEPPVVWQGTVGWYRRHLHSWDRGQLMAGGVRGVQWQVRSPTPRRHLECLVTSPRGGLQVEAPQSDLQTEGKPTGMSGDEDWLKISGETESLLL